MSAFELSDELLLRYLDRATSAQEDAFVAARLQLDAEARRRYVRLSHLHALVAEVARDPTTAVGRRAVNWRRIAVVAAAACILAGALTWSVGVHDSESKGILSADQQDRITEHFSSCRLLDFHGAVTIERQRQIMTAAPGMTFQLGDLIQVGPGATATLESGMFGRVSLESGTLLHVTSMQPFQAITTVLPPPSELGLVSGTIHCQLHGRMIIHAEWARDTQADVAAWAAYSHTHQNEGTVDLTVRRSGDALMAAVARGQCTVDAGGQNSRVLSGRIGVAPFAGQPWLASTVPLPLPVGTIAWRTAGSTGVAEEQPLTMDAQAWHAEPLGICAVPAAGGDGVDVSDGSGHVLGRVPLPPLTDSAEALEGLEALAVVGEQRSWLLRQPRLADDGSLHAASLVDEAPAGAPHALGGLFAPIDLAVAMPPTAPAPLAHALAVALPQGVLDACHLAIGDRLVPLGDPKSDSVLVQALARCAHTGLVVVATANRPTIFYDRRMPAAQRPELGPAMREVAAGGLVRLMVPEPAARP